MKMSDVSMCTCRTTGISELYWDGGRICIDLGNDIDEVAATKIFESIRDHERLTQENARLREALSEMCDTHEDECQFVLGCCQEHFDLTGGGSCYVGNAKKLLTELEKGDE
ncbi:hypothetical protein ABXZ88_002055 [Vibrio fluvialis]